MKLNKFKYAFRSVLLILVVIIIVRLIDINCNGTNKKDNNDSLADFSRFIEGKYCYQYVFKNETYHDTFKQYILFSKYGNCDCFTNMCEGFSIEQSKYSIKNNVITIKSSNPDETYKLRIIDKNTLRFINNVEMFTCNNKEVKDSVTLIKK